MLGPGAADGGVPSRPDGRCPRPAGTVPGPPPVDGRTTRLAPPAALGQLTAFRQVFETALLPKLAGRHGPWALGPTFTGSALIRADADLIAAGLLLDLKTSAKHSLRIENVLQVLGYALLDFDDEYKLAELGIFSARYADLATWGLSELLEELAGHQVSLRATRYEFRELLLTRQCPPR